MTRRTAPTSLALAAVLALAVSLGACSSDGSDGAASTTTAPSTTTASSTTTATDTSAAVDDTTGTTAATPATTDPSNDAPCTITGEVTGAQEQTWTDAPVALVTDGVVLPTGATSPAKFTVDDGQTLLNVYAAGTGPAFVQYGVVGGAGSKTYASTSPGATDVTVGGGSVEADAVAGDETVAVSARITCT